MKAVERLIPGIGERAGFVLKAKNSRSKPVALNGEVTKIEITARGIWVTFRSSMHFGRQKNHRIEWPSGVQGWTRLRNDVVLITHSEGVETP